METNEKIIEDIVDMYFGDSKKSLKELIDEYAVDLSEKESEQVFTCLRKVVSEGERRNDSY